MAMKNMLKKNLKHNVVRHSEVGSESQSGRSMVEMLGAIAVMGVLSITGVQGYQAAMKRHRANELINEAAGRALMVSQQLMAGKELKDATFGDYPATETGHGKFSDKPIPLTGGEFFKIPITGMDESTCNQMKAIAGGSLRRVDCKDEGNGKVTADLIYQKDLSATEGTIPGDTNGTSGGTGNATTRSYDNNREGCEENGYQYCSNNICITKEEVCESGSASCVQYPGTSTLNSGGHAGKADDGETMCYCPGGQVYTEANGCIVACSGHGTLDENEDCVCQGGYCGVVCENQITCQHGTWTPDKCECDANWYGPLCDSDCNGFRRDNGDCRSCYDSNTFSTTKDECDKCSNREMITYNGKNYCALTTAGCNARYPKGGFRHNDGYCYSCSTSYSFLTTKGECDQCSNREMVGNYCALSTAACNAAYPTSGGVRHNDGDCYSCSGSYSIFTTKDECDQCSNREMITYNGKNYCALSTAACNAEYPTSGGFRDNDGDCYSCSESDDIGATKDECDECGNLRYMDGNYCKKK